MGVIQQLSEDLIKKIAAGEVIERPASVVKELVENSIDAGSTKIEIEVKRAGKYLKISDDGKGIKSEDIPLLFKRHATSKLKSFDDLWDLNTLGFRGEALASISSVSKVTCRSKNIDEEVGFELKLVDEKIDKKSDSIPKGTVFEIDDLFYNIPARQKFLKTGSTEVGHIQDAILSEALSHPEIAFKLINNNSVVLETSGSGDLQMAIVEVLGNDLKKNLIEVSSKNSSLSLSGFISALEITRSNKKNIFTFINSRPIKCPILIKAIQSSYDGLLPPGKFPVVLLNLSFKPKLVDVNVHPTKKEVRYTNSSEVYNLVLHTLQESVSNHYKKSYKEKSVYKLPTQEPKISTPEKEFTGQNSGHSTNDFIKERPTESYTQAAFDLYEPIQDSGFSGQESEPKDLDSFEEVSESKSSICKINNLSFAITYMTSPVANMKKIGNKTLFEVGQIYDENVQVIASGEIIGDERYQRTFFNNLSELSSFFYKAYAGSEEIIQKKVISQDEESELPTKKNNRKKPSEKNLYEIWDRDNWTCVYCAKQLIDPKIENDAIKVSEKAFATYINKKGEEVTKHIINEHIATYDHYLPASKLPQFNNEKENLFASCQECNRKKSDSLNLESWKPERKNSWNETLTIAGVEFDTPRGFLQKIK